MMQKFAVAELRAKAMDEALQNFDAWSHEDNGGSNGENDENDKNNNGPVCPSVEPRLKSQIHLGSMISEGDCSD